MPRSGSSARHLDAIEAAMAARISKDCASGEGQSLGVFIATYA